VQLWQRDRGERNLGNGDLGDRNLGHGDFGK
jgi:hypothetical protein